MVQSTIFTILFKRDEYEGNKLADRPIPNIL